MTELLTELVAVGRRELQSRSFTNDFVVPAIPVNAQNVADYLYKVHDEVENLSLFPNVAPAWPLAFFRWKDSGVYRTDGKLERGNLPMDVGFFMAAFDLSLPDNDSALKDCPEPTARWRVLGLGFSRTIGNRHINMLSMQWFVRGDGMLLPHMAARLGKVWPDLSSEADDTPPDKLASWAFVPFLTLSFAHCKNVNVIREAVPFKVKAKRDRKHGWSPEAWHTLTIEPMCKRLADAGAEERGGFKRALHIMHGHFKDYREGRGLFGKLHGTWWWDFRIADTGHKHRYDIKVGS